MSKDISTHINWTRLAAVLGALATFWLLVTAAASVLDGRFLRQSVYQADQVADSAWKAEQRSMTLDVLCAPAVDPRNRRCR